MHSAKFKAIVLSVSLSLSLSLSLGLGLAQPALASGDQVKVERTKNKQAQWAMDLVKKNYEFGFISAEKVSVKSQDPCGIEAGSRQKPKNGNKREVGDRLCLNIDDHGDTYIYIESIRPDSVVLRYEASFDHSSFGESLRTIDVGSFHVALTNLPVKSTEKGSELDNAERAAAKPAAKTPSVTTSTAPALEKIPDPKKSKSKTDKSALPQGK